MTTRPSAPSSSSSSTTAPAAAAMASPSTGSIGSPSLSAPPIRMRHPLPAPPLQCAQPPLHRSRSIKSSHHHQPTSSSASSAYSTNRTSPRYSYPGTLSSISPSTSPYYSSSHPSPVPSTTSSAGGSSVSGGSSLRTPPDLLVNGASVGHTGKGLQQLAVNSWNGQLVKPRPPRNLAKEEIRRRQSLLKDLPQLPPTFSLPSPPPSPKLEPARIKKRRRDSVDTNDDPAAPLPPSSRQPEHHRSSTIALANHTRHRSLTPSTLSSLAAAYRSAARELKHAADARASSLSASRPSYLAARPTQVSALEQLDAVLLFCYAFWLDDLAASCPGGGCIAKNWISLFGLLRYATNAHSDLGNDVLLGVCRLVESAVLRKLHAHDSAVLLKTLTANTGVSMGEVTQMVQRQTADLERSDRLAAQARNLLSLSNLAASHPELLAKALGSTVVNSEAAAKSVDPGSEESCGGLAWPLDSMSAMPFLVAFGRCAVAEQARRAGVEFALKVVERE
ncbi:hypothetical protein PSEUBRA_000669 [Kalmanozyma brasiliensis GHG001]|uniref:uncharacterized protein n=1 Tax=Kalmanozyma brasiliensis (strain GHG001) TaxID=1365824 RepID=UPI0028680A67|nr:uncharacterized protein PSEUBRA_000669 [Kalmanozyma brasiliensis GHG001]EST09458.2 hypothetical protein PSEUBRA_000669 [Kalmanozyma brasiliensis GHG001]